MNKKRNNLIARIIVIMLLFIGSSSLLGYLSSCKKIDLTRYAAVKTNPVSSISASSVVAEGDIIDLGESAVDHGFCWSEGSGKPTIYDYIVSGGGSTNTGNYSIPIYGLQQKTSYSIRSFIVDQSGIIYGNTEYFTTLQNITNQWLHYDDGSNKDGIGYTEGGEFDVAVIFPKESLQQYSGSHITKVRFFPKVDAPAEYYITIWEGANPPELIVIEIVENPNIDAWTEHTLSTPYPINVSKDLWVGYWIVDYPPDTYPAGVDFGPADTGFGDMISNDGGLTWGAMSLLDPPNLDYNWNLQAFVESGKGVQSTLSKSTPDTLVTKRKKRDNMNSIVPSAEQTNKK